MMMDEGDDVEKEEDGNLQSYARKGMAQELAKKLGLFAAVPGADKDNVDPAGDGTGTGMDAIGDGGMQKPAGDDSGGVDPAMLEEILKALTAKGQ
jgi:hypothetical protein